MTSSNTVWDVLVLGAGPAGSTAAKLLCDSGLKVLLLDKARFPRHKTCASWVNRLAFERFPYLHSKLPQLVDAPFYGIRFFKSDLSDQKTALEAKPSGYVTLRSKFDNGLKDLAVEAGAVFREEESISQIEPKSDGIVVFTSKGEHLLCKILVGADGANSRVAELSGVRPAWSPKEICLCANEDIPCDTKTIEKFYGKQFPIEVVIQYCGINGYGWIFPKRNHICVGVGAQLKEGENIRELYDGFLSSLKQKGLIPRELESHDVHFAIDPAGGVNRQASLVRGRVILIGDAAGFVSGTTGEGIYPAMISAQVASRVILESLRQADVARHLKTFDARWKEELGSYIKSLPGGKNRATTIKHLGWIFRSNLACRIAAKIFLYGRNPDVRTAIESLWR